MGKRRGEKTSNRAQTPMFAYHCKPSFIVGAGPSVRSLRKHAHTVQSTLLI